MSWWEGNNLRLIQNNISETDADLDVDILIQKLKDMSANVLMLNTGGIEAFYPTTLEYQYKSQYLKKDLIKEVTEKCHENNIKFIARFDFSKAHESIYRKQPNWFYKSKDNQIANYNGMVHTCVNGFYQREYSLKIIEEVINNYSVDGIFFNMFGYQTKDYSNNYYGICHCDSCNKRFKELFGESLPYEEDLKSPIYQDYMLFKERTTKEMLDHIHELVKSKSNEIVVSTYNEHKVDIVRKESNTAIDRPYPKWIYSASENVKSLEDSWDDKLISNCVINAVDIFYRFVGVSKNEIEIRLYESIASGSGLDFCIIGVFDGYPDRDNFEVVKKVYEYHKINEKYFGQFTSVADVLLIKPSKLAGNKSTEEYLGLFKVLKEQHILFDVIHQEKLINQLNKFNNCKLIIVPDIKRFSENELNLLKDFQAKGVNIIATSESFTGDTSNLSLLSNIFGGNYKETKEKSRSDYLEVNNKNIFKSFKNRDWIFLDGIFNKIRFQRDTAKLLSYISTARFGPPERIGGHDKSGDFGMGIKNIKGNVSAYIPWQVGYLYYNFGFEDHKNVMSDLIDYILEDDYVITTDCPENVEIFLNKYDGKNYILQFLNLSGFNGTTYHKPNVINELNVKLKLENKAQRVLSIAEKKSLEYELQGTDLTIKINNLKSYEAIIIQV